MAKIGIVTVLYNSESVLDDFFKSLNSQNISDFVLYIIDNASKDKSLEKAHSLAKGSSFNCVFFEEKNNWGVAKGNNIGITAALKDKCDYVLLANNDTKFSSDTLQRLLYGLETTKADMVTPKIYFYGTNLLWCAGGGFRKWKGMTYHIGFGQMDLDIYNYDKQVDYSPTCFMLIKSSVFTKVGLMDERYFVYYDDSDFIWRAVKQNKLTLYYIPESVVYHKVSVSTGGSSSPFTIYYSTRNNFFFIRKNFNGFSFLSSISYRLLSTMKKYISSSFEERQIIRKALKDSINITINKEQ